MANRRRCDAALPAEWRGTVFLWEGRALYLGRALDTTPHAHHAVQICIGLEDGFGLRLAGKIWRRYRGALISADRMHQLDGGGAALALVYLDPESAAAGRILGRIPGRGFRAMSAEAVARHAAAFASCLHAPDDERRARRAADAVVDALGAGSVDIAAADHRVAKALALIEAAAGRRIGLAALASQVALSPSRFAYLFRAQTGLPLRRYLLWLRLRDALASVATGASLTAAALDAGFADSAHLTRTFRRMFGLAPSGLARHSKLVSATSVPSGGWADPDRP